QGGSNMSKSFRKNRLVGIVLIAIAIVALAILTGNLKTANAQFPKLPGLPGGGKMPRLPGLPGGQQQHGGDLNDLMDLGKKWSDLNDMDNPKRQEELGQSIRSLRSP